MKKKYLTPSIKVKRVVTDCTMAAISVGGNTGITPADPGETPPTEAGSKGSILSDDQEWPQVHNAWE